MPFILSKQNTTTTDNKRKTGVMRSNQKNIRYGNEIYLVKLIFLSCSGVAFCTSSYPQNHPEESVFFFFFFSLKEILSITHFYTNLNAPLIYISVYLMWQKCLPKIKMRTTYGTTSLLQYSI